jgi:hypothetical protein
MNALIFQVDVFSAAAEPPQNLAQVQERAKDIQYSSKTRFNTSRLKEIEGLRSSLHRVLEKLPKALLSDPDVQRLSAVSTRGPVTLVHFINRHNTRSLDFKDYEFSRATVTDLWEGGHNDVRRAISNPDWQRVTVVKFEFIRMPDSTGFGDYTEAGQVIPVRFRGESGSYVHAMFLDCEPPIAGGREIWAFRKSWPRRRCAWRRIRSAAS